MTQLFTRAESPLFLIPPCLASRLPIPLVCLLTCQKPSNFFCNGLATVNVLGFMSDKLYGTNNITAPLVPRWTWAINQGKILFL